MPIRNWQPGVLPPPVVDTRQLAIDLVPNRIPPALRELFLDTPYLLDKCLRKQILLEDVYMLDTEIFWIYDLAVKSPTHVVSYIVGGVLIVAIYVKLMNIKAEFHS